MNEYSRSEASKFADGSTRTLKVGTEARVTECFAAGKQGRKKQGTVP